MIDNRTLKEYDSGHIPGAILIPVDSYTFSRESRVGEMIQKIGNTEKKTPELYFERLFYRGGVHFG